MLTRPASVSQRLVGGGERALLAAASSHRAAGRPSGFAAAAPSEAGPRHMTTHGRVGVSSVSVGGRRRLERACDAAR